MIEWKLLKKHRVCSTTLLVLLLGAASVGILHRLHLQVTHVGPSVREAHKNDLAIQDGHVVWRKCGREFEQNPRIKVQYEKVKQQSPYDGSKGKYKDRVVILTPISNAGSWIHQYFRVICSLNYPHHLISVVLGEDSSTDPSFEIAKILAMKLERCFQRVEVHHFQRVLTGAPRDRHEPTWQRKRRAHMAAARNELLSRGLRGEDWVLWVDSDVHYLPADIIQHLMSSGADVTAPSCMKSSPDGTTTVYDLNSWQETPESKAYLAGKPVDFLMVEGYQTTQRRYLPHIRDEGLTVPLDGVGGCTLLVRASSHREGLVFPTFVFDHHIETEGLARMAKFMNFTVKGLPFVFVFHS